MGVLMLDAMKSDALSMMDFGLRIGIEVRRYVLSCHAEEVDAPVAGYDGSDAKETEISPVFGE